MLKNDYPMYEIHKKLILHEIQEELDNLLCIALTPALHLASKYENFEVVVDI